MNYQESSGGANADIFTPKETFGLKEEEIVATIGEVYFGITNRIGAIGNQIELLVEEDLEEDEKQEIADAVIAWTTEIDQRLQDNLDTLSRSEVAAHPSIAQFIECELAIFRGVRELKNLFTEDFLLHIHENDQWTSNVFSRIDRIVDLLKQVHEMPLIQLYKSILQERGKIPQDNPRYNIQKLKQVSV